MTKANFDGLAKPSKMPSCRKANIPAGFDGFDGFDRVQIVQPERGLGWGGTLTYNLFSHFILSSQSRHKPYPATLSGLTAFSEIDALPVKKHLSGALGLSCAVWRSTRRQTLLTEPELLLVVSYWQRQTILTISRRMASLQLGEAFLNTEHAHTAAAQRAGDVTGQFRDVVGAGADDFKCSWIVLRKVSPLATTRPVDFWRAL